MRLHRFVVGVLLICLLVGLGGAATEYSLSTGSEQEIPDRDVDFEGDTYTLSSLSRVAEGDDLSVDASGPSDKGYDVNLYNPDNQIADSEFVGGGDKSFSFDMSFTPGSYMLVIEQDGDIKTVHPVIIKAYDVSHSGPSSVEEGESFEVTVEVTELSDEKDLNYVQVVLGDDFDDVTERATKSNGEYTATVSIDDLGTGDYSLYAVVRGTKEVRDRDELLGVSDKTTVTIESTPDDSSGDGGEGSDGGAGGSGDDQTDDTPTEEGTDEDDTEDTPDIKVEPDTEEEARIGAAGAGTSGTVATFTKTNSVRRLTFDESASGSIAVREYNDPPASVVEEITTQFAANTATDGDGGGDADSDDADTPAETPTDTAENSTDDGGVNTSSDAAAPGPKVVTVVDISPTSDSVTGMNATVEIDVPRADLENPETAAILHRTPNGTWNRLNTSLSNTSEDTVTLHAAVTSFSLFAVVDGDAVDTTPTPVQVTTPTPSPTATPTASPVPATASPTPTPTLSATPTATPDSVVTPQPTASPGTDTPGASGPGFTSAGGVLAFVVSLLLARRL